MNKHIARFIVGSGIASVPLILAGNLWHINVLAYVGMGILCMIPVLGAVERFSRYHVLPTSDELR